MLLVLHVDEIYDNQSSQIPESKLTSDLSGSLDVCPEDGLLGLGPNLGLSCIDIDGDQCLSRINDYRSPRL